MLEILDDNEVSRSELETIIELDKVDKQILSKFVLFFVAHQPSVGVIFPVARHTPTWLALAVKRTQML